jgi:hypothetical protein
LEVGREIVGLKNVEKVENIRREKEFEGEKYGLSI